jgi:hypothetical protein
MCPRVDWRRVIFGSREIWGEGYNSGVKTSFLLLAISGLVLMALTALMGLRVSGSEGFLRHVLLGVLTGLYVCFVHVVVLTYFVVQDKIMKQSVMLHGLDAGFAVETATIKSRAARLCVAGIATVILVVALGAAIEARLSPIAHMVAAFGCIAAQGVIFFSQYAALGVYEGLYQRAFGEGATVKPD